MTDHPPVREIDAVAHFVEAVRELRRSPFFLEEYRDHGITWHPREPNSELKGKFPGEDVLRAVLVPFRRVWLKSEPCYYRKVANILKRRSPTSRTFLDHVMLDTDRPIRMGIPQFSDVNLSIADAIDLWLNAKYHHVGASPKGGQFTRNDFERFRREIGLVLFEYYFLVALDHVGCCLFNILRIAEQILEAWRQIGLVPSFQLDADAASESIERKTPGITPPTDSPAHRVWRLRRRGDYNVLSHFLRLVGCSDQQVASLALDCVTFDDVVRKLGKRFEELSEDNEHDTFLDINTFVDQHGLWGGPTPARVGSLMQRSDGTFVWGGECLAILRDQYLAFVKALSRDIFE